MGFNFNTAESRNPTTPKGPTAEETKIASLEAELQQHNDFLEENGMAIKFDMWKDIKASIAENVKAIHESEKTNGFTEI